MIQSLKIIIIYIVAGAASVARAWSGYIDSILGGVISNYTVETVGELHEELLGRYPDFLAFAVCISYTCILGKKALYYRKQGNKQGKYK